MTLLKTKNIFYINNLSPNDNKNKFCINYF